MPVTADDLLAGPRGRRLLLGFALASERARGLADRDDSLSHTWFHAAFHLDKSREKSQSALFGWADGCPVRNPRIPVATPDDVAARIDVTPLVAPDDTLLRDCLADSVASAMYWQAPDADDLLAATAPVRDALLRVAEQVAASSAALWWATPAPLDGQWTVQWDDVPEPDDSPSLLQQRDKLLADESIAATERPSDPTANWTGLWWSCPGQAARSSSRLLPDGLPAGAWFVEDDFGQTRGTARRLVVDPEVRVLEIDTPDAWTRLCERYPVEVTASRRHDWYRATGRDSRWAIPDWAAVADEYDAAHLQPVAYLAGAGRALPVGHDMATVIAGWNPDETRWLRDCTSPEAGPSKRFDLDELRHDD